FARLAESCEPGARPSPSLRLIAAGGAPLDAGIKEKVEAVFGLTLHNGYGLTEGSGVCWTRLDDVNDDCSVGPPNVGVEVRICDKDGNELPQGQVGELWMRGPSIMKGYYKMPDRTAEVLRPDGWLNSQDLASQGPDGRIHIHGRSKELIIRSGSNACPLESGTALNAHPLVRCSAVPGHHSAGKENIVPVMELNSEAQRNETNRQAFLKEGLPPSTRPNRFIYMGNLLVAP